MRLIIIILICVTFGAQATDTIRYVNSDFQEFISEAPNNSILLFENGEVVREQVTAILNKKNITFVFRNFTLKAKTTGASETPPHSKAHKWPRNRSHIHISRCQNLTFTGLTIEGPHTNGGTGTEAYVVELEAQHGIEVLYSNGIRIVNSQISNIYGDGIYIGRNSSEIVISESSISNNGRQGIAITSANNVIIQNNNLSMIRRSHIDLEPNTAKDTVQNIRIIGNTFGRKRLKWLAAASGRGVVKDVVVSKNVMNCPADIRLGNIKNESKQGPYTFEQNKSTRPYGTRTGEIWRLINVDGFTARDNNIMAQKNRNMYLVRTTNSKNIDLSNNTVPNGKSGIKQ